MKEHEYKLKNEEIQSQLRAILDECKADKKPVYLACEEHGEYVVIDRREYNGLSEASELIDSARELKERHQEKATGEYTPNAEVFRELRSRYGF